MLRYSLIAVAALLAAQTPTWAADGATLEIVIKDFAFSPQTITVPAGTTVVWVNRDEAPHSVVARNKQFRSRPLDTNETFSRTFDQPGTIEYVCGLHPQMNGKIEIGR